jgi:hypothetical protein
LDAIRAKEYVPRTWVLRKISLQNLEVWAFELYSRVMAIRNAALKLLRKMH